MNVKNCIFSAILLIGPLGAETIGIIGGKSSGNDNYAAFVVSDSTAVVSTSSLPVTSSALKVAINQYSQALIGGRTTAPAMYAAFVSPDSLTPLVISNVPIGNNCFLNSVAINILGQGFIGGSNLNNPYAAWVTFGLSTATAISPFPSGAGTIDSVTLNTSGRGLIGGAANNLQDAYAARVSFGSPNASVITGLPTGGSSAIFSVALNESDQGLIGGVNNGSGYAAFIPPNSTTPIPISGLPIGSSAIGNAAFEGQGVALNSSGQGLIVGHDHANAYAAWVFYDSTIPTPITPLPIGGNSVILTTALNDSGTGLIGGLDKSSGTAAYAAWVFSGSSTPVPITNLPSGGTSEILAVAVNQFGQGLIGGINNGNAYAALLAPGSTLPVPLTDIPIGEGTTLIDSVALVLSSLAIPTESLSGNNLILTNYINQNTPQTVFYFIPSIFNDTLSSALESVAPTRNAISIFAADNNLFSLNTAFSLHSQASRQFRRANAAPMQIFASNSTQGFLQENLIAANSEDFIVNNSKEISSPQALQERPYEIWGELIGAVAYQKAQDQTPAFDPAGGGFIFAFDKKATTDGRFGAGVAYTFTHVHEKQDAGHSNINQEYLFLYGLWDNSKFYFDGAIWGGLFQINNVRNIHMTGFDFETKSRPSGWQIAPHAEFGYDKQWLQLTLEPFAMFDWINNWQWSYKEIGNGPFNFRQKDHYSSFLRSELGFRFYETITFSSWRIGFKEKASYVNKKPFKVGNVTASLVGAPGSFTVDTFTTTQNLGIAELEILFEPIDPRYLYGSIDYQGEFSSKYQSHVVTLGVNWNF